MSNFMDPGKVRDFSDTAGSPEEEELTKLRESIAGGCSRPNRSRGDTNLPVPTANKFSQEAPFAVKVLDDNCWSEFAVSWRPNMATPIYIGETTMILQYLQSLEQLYRVTMPIKACGIDPIVFDDALGILSANDADEEPVKKTTFDIDSGVQGEDGYVSNSYELISVDGDLYMSCVSSVLDAVYMNSVIADVTSAVREKGEYTFYMVGYRHLRLTEGEQEGRLLNTLKLNTYEMSVLCSYMQQFPGMSITFGVGENGKQCIRFEGSHQ